MLGKDKFIQFLYDEQKNFSELSKLLDHKDVSYKDKNGTYLHLVMRRINQVCNAPGEQFERQISRLISILNVLSDKGVSVSETDENKQTSLHIAALSGNVRVIAAFFNNKNSQKQLDINSQDIGGETPLICAATTKNYEVVKYLLEWGANPNIQDLECNSAIWHILKAIKEDKDNGNDLYEIDFKILKLLLQYHSDPNIVVSIPNDYQPQMSFVNHTMRQGTSTMRFDPQASIANQWVMGQDERTPLEYACEMKDFEVIKLLLLYGADINHSDATRRTLIEKAYESKDFEMCQVLFEHGRNIDCELISKLLTKAVESKENTEERLNFIELFLKYGANPNEILTTKNSESLLKFAVREKQFGAAKLLLKYGAKTNIPDKFEDTVLHNISCKSDEEREIAVLVLEASSEVPNVNKKGQDGKTPLIRAIEKGDIEKVKLLLQYGADSNLADDKNKTPIQYALNRGDIIQLLLDYGVELTDNVDAKINLERAKQLIKELQNNKLQKQEEDVRKKETEVSNIKSNIFGKFSDADNTRLTIIVQELKKLLLEKSRFNDMCEALKSQRNNQVQLLLEQGISPNEIDNASLSLPCIAIRTRELESQEKSVTVLKTLIDKGANLYLQDSKGWTILHQAVAYGNIAVVKYLVERELSNFENTQKLTEIKDKNGQTAIELAKSLKKQEIEAILTNSYIMQDTPLTLPTQPIPEEPLYKDPLYVLNSKKEVEQPLSQSIRPVEYEVQPLTRRQAIRPTSTVAPGTFRRNMSGTSSVSKSNSTIPQGSVVKLGQTIRGGSQSTMAQTIRPQGRPTVPVALNQSTMAQTTRPQVRQPVPASLNQSTMTQTARQGRPPIGPGTRASASVMPRGMSSVMPRPKRELEGGGREKQAKRM